MPNHTVWMNRALELAPRGFPEATPNPLVGCVIVKNNRVIGEGWHHRFGGPHAEIEALKKAGTNAKGADLYCTLEPCAHHGKTPPCTEAILRARIRAVTAAMKDPHPKVDGKGIAGLHSRGIRARIDPHFTLEAQALNLPFLSTVQRRRPYIFLKTAMTLDGKIADHQNRSQWITSEPVRRLSRSWRGLFDAILVGVNTVLRDNPRLTAEGGGRNPLRIVLDPALKSPRGSRIFSTQEAGTAIVPASGKASVASVYELSKKNVEILDVPSVSRNGSGAGLDLQTLCKLLDLKGIQTLLVEGGGATHARFIEEGLVDELLWFIAPKIIGGAKALTAVEGKGLPIGKAVSFTGLRSHTLDKNTLLIRATRHPKGLFWPILDKM